MWAGCTGTKISRSLRSGLEISCGPKWKLRTRPCARNISCRPPPPPSARRPGSQLIILHHLRPPLLKVRGLIRLAILPRIHATLPDALAWHRHRRMRPSRDRGGRAVITALVLTASSINQVASAGGDDPIRKKATSRLQVSQSALILQADTVETRFDANSHVQRGWARGRNVARRRVQKRPAVPRSDRGRGTRAMYDRTPCRSPVCDFRLGCSLPSAGRTEGEPSEGTHGI